MRATLQDRASNPYYGQWPRAFPRESGSKTRSIARNGVAASAGFDAFDARARDFPGKPAPLRRKFAVATKIKRGMVRSAQEAA
jgi:hypothetical protein